MIIVAILTLNYLVFLIARFTNTDPLDYYEPGRWKAFYIWLLKKQLKGFGETTTYLERHEMIQMAYRVGQCWECIKEGKCQNCGCDTEGRMNGDNDVCSAGKWGIKLTKEEFKEHVDDTGGINDFSIGVNE